MAVRACLNQLEHDQLVVLCRLPNVSLHRLAICTVLEAYGLSIKDIERELYQIVDNSFNSQLYFHGLLIDLCNMARLTGTDVEEQVIKDELIVIVRDVLSVVSAVTITGYKLMSLEIESPDTLLLGYSSAGDYIRQPL